MGFRGGGIQFSLEQSGNFLHTRVVGQSLPDFPYVRGGTVVLTADEDPSSAAAPAVLFLVKKDETALGNSEAKFVLAGDYLGFEDGARGGDFQVITLDELGARRSRLSVSDGIFLVARRGGEMLFEGNAVGANRVVLSAGTSQASPAAVISKIILESDDPIHLRKTGLDTSGCGLNFAEQVDPAAPAADIGTLYVRDNGAGKSQLCIRFNTGAIQVIATQP